MAAEMFMGIYFNLSFWYKLIDGKQNGGAYFSLVGCSIIILINIFPYSGIWLYGVCGQVLPDGVAMLLSYFVGQRKISY